MPTFTNEPSELTAARAEYLYTCYLLHDTGYGNTAHHDMTDESLAEEQRLADNVTKAQAAWIACAPAEPTTWWPGGWEIRGSTGDLIIREPGHSYGALWRTKAAAESFLRGGPAAENDRRAADGTLAGLGEATVRWCATHRTPYFDERLVLDGEHWAEFDLLRAQPCPGLPEVP